jgi:hypothetical protein
MTIEHTSFSQGTMALFQTSGGTLLFSVPWSHVGQVAPSEGQPGGFVYTAGLTLTGNQVQSLRDGGLFLAVATANFPNGEVRGAILPVPEPSVCALSALISGILFLGYRKHHCKWESGLRN